MFKKIYFLYRDSHRNRDLPSYYSFYNYGGAVITYEKNGYIHREFGPAMTDDHREAYFLYNEEIENV